MRVCVASPQITSVGLEIQRSAPALTAATGGDAGGDDETATAIVAPKAAPQRFGSLLTATKK